MEFLLQTQGNFGGFFCLTFTFYDGFQGNRALEALSFDFQMIKLEI